MILPSCAVFHLEKSKQIKTITITQPELNRDVLLVNNSKRPVSIAMQIVSKTILGLTKEAHSMGNWRGELLF
jgi:hypothetical protein